MKKTVDKNRELRILTVIFIAAFLAMIAYLSYFLLFRSEDFINNSYNKRIDALSAKTVRGEILASDGTVLAYTDIDAEGNETRVYPFGKRFAHAVGYATSGKMGVESVSNFYLLRSHSAFSERLTHAFTGEKNQGDAIVTTLDPVLQGTAFDALGSYSGAVIVMEPESGRVLAMVSKPDFDPNAIDEIYATLAADNEAATLVNRTTQGRYAPGSTFKILTTLEFMREYPSSYQNYRFDCTGSFLSDGKEIHCYHNNAHGEEDLMTSFAKSCNSSYASLSLDLTTSKLQTLANSLLFNQKIDFDLPTEASRFTLSQDASDAELMETAIGQGKTLATPLQMLLLVSAIDGGGTVHQPYLIEKAVSDTGRLVEDFTPSHELSLFDKSDAEILENYLRAVVTDGTGRGLESDRYTSYGKTGTAEYNAAGDSHAWFVGFAKFPEKPDIAIAVILEGAGAGSTYAVPAARAVFEAYANE